MSGWIAVDLDGTLAHYTGWKNFRDIGDPIPLMLERVKKWLKQGKTVKIFTARVAIDDPIALLEIEGAIRAWCLKHIGQELEITCKKDMTMIELWDDRCIQVVPNFGSRVDGKL